MVELAEILQKYGARLEEKMRSLALEAATSAGWDPLPTEVKAKWDATVENFNRFLEGIRDEVERLKAISPPSSKSSVIFGQTQMPSHTCPVCGEAVAGGPDEYLGHIRTKHPEEWRRLETDPGYTTVRRLPTVTIRGKRYYLDARLREYRAVDDPHDRIPLEPEYAKLLGEASEGSVAWNAVVESIIEEKQREAGTGILRCRYCGAPYAYRENLEIHERGCQRRGG